MNKLNMLIGHSQCIVDHMWCTKHKHLSLLNACLKHNSYSKLLILCMSDSSSHMVLQYRLKLHRILTLEHKRCLRVLCSDWRNMMCSCWQRLNIHNMLMCMLCRHKFQSNQVLEWICKFLLDRKYCSRL